MRVDEDEEKHWQKRKNEDEENTGKWEIVKMMKTLADEKECRWRKHWKIRNNEDEENTGSCSDLFTNFTQLQIKQLQKLGYTIPIAPW